LSKVGSEDFGPRYLSSKLSYEAAALLAEVEAELALDAALDALVEAAEA
jgi:hypothetical protein